MESGDFSTVIEWTGKAIEASGVAIIVIGIIVSIVRAAGRTGDEGLMTGTDDFASLSHGRFYWGSNF